MMGYTVTDGIAEKRFQTYNEARKFMAETKRNWESQINEAEPSAERESMIERYFGIRIEKEDI